MALGESLVDASGVEHAMAGLLSVRTSFARRRMTLGYREARLAADCALGQEGALLRGHEFHYATIADPGSDEPFAFVTDAYGAPATAGRSAARPCHRLVLPRHRRGLIAQALQSGNSNGRGGVHDRARSPSARKALRVSGAAW